MAIDIFVNTASGLQGSAELDFGLRELRRTLNTHTDVGAWHDYATQAASPTPAQLSPQFQGKQVLLVLNPALIVSDRLLQELAHALASSPQSAVVPADPRGASGPWQIDYASRAGFERYVARRQTLPRWDRAPQHSPWVLLTNTTQLAQAVASGPGLSWEEAAQQLLANQGMVAQHAFVHSYASYQKADRREMLDLLPASVTRLLDVGGGEGGFALAFQQQRAQNQVALVEPNAQAAAAAASQGVTVHQALFETLDAAQLGHFDCISFLDVLEHLQEPLQALRHASQLLPPGGHVLLSIPNVGHWSVVQDLLQGRFDYLPLGILCCTHVRFFTERSLRQLLADAKLQVLRWRSTPSPLPAELALALGALQDAGMPVDMASLGADSFHVLAVKR
jgi:2-polyprenyl-3-methyl-5-hydroxy-6-metoxy-1,4-benzoquinol methylase